MRKVIRHPPVTIDGATVLTFTPIDARHSASGRTRHMADRDVTAEVAALAIARYNDDDGVYLFYCDASWQVITDTLHESIAQAIDQAEFEFTGTNKTWVPCDTAGNA